MNQPASEIVQTLVNKSTFDVNVNTNDDF
jgi:hypothetical protein